MFLRAGQPVIPPLGVEPLVSGELVHNEFELQAHREQTSARLEFMRMRGAGNPPQYSAIPPRPPDVGNLARPPAPDQSWFSNPCQYHSVQYPSPLQQWSSRTDSYPRPTTSGEMRFASDPYRPPTWEEVKSVCSQTSSYSTSHSPHPNFFPNCHISTETTINGHFFSHQFPGATPHTLATSTQNLSTPTYHSPQPNPYPWIYSPISQTPSYEPSSTIVHPQVVPTKTMTTQPIYYSAPPPTAYEQPHPISDLKQVEPAFQIHPFSMEPDRVHDMEVPVVGLGYSSFMPEPMVKLEGSEKPPSPQSCSNELSPKERTDAKMCELREWLKRSTDTFISEYKEELRLLMPSWQSRASQVDDGQKVDSLPPLSKPKLISTTRPIPKASSSPIDVDNGTVHNTFMDSCLNMSYTSTDRILGVNDSTSMPHVAASVFGVKRESDKKISVTSGDGTPVDVSESIISGANFVSDKKVFVKNVQALGDELEIKSRSVKDCDDVDSVSVAKYGGMNENSDNQKGESSKNVKVTSEAGESVKAVATSLQLGSSVSDHLSSSRNSSISTPALGFLFRKSDGTHKLVGVRANQKMNLCGKSTLHLFDKVSESDGLCNVCKKIVADMSIRDKGGGHKTHRDINVSLMSTEGLYSATHVPIEADVEKRVMADDREVSKIYSSEQRSEPPSDRLVANAELWLPDCVSNVAAGKTLTIAFKNLKGEMCIPLKELLSVYCGAERVEWDDILAGGSYATLLTKEICDDVWMSFDALKLVQSGLRTVIVFVINKSTDIGDVIVRFPYLYKFKTIDGKLVVIKRDSMNRNQLESICSAQSIILLGRKSLVNSGPLLVFRVVDYNATLESKWKTKGSEELIRFAHPLHVKLFMNDVEMVCNGMKPFVSKYLNILFNEGNDISHLVFAKTAESIMHMKLVIEKENGHMVIGHNIIKKKEEFKLMGFDELHSSMSLDFIKDLVTVASGHIYEGNLIAQWLNSEHQSCFKSGQRRIHIIYVPIYALKTLLHQWCEEITALISCSRDFVFVMGGKKILISIMEGKVVALHFTFSTYSACIEFTPRLEDLLRLIPRWWVSTFCLKMLSMGLENWGQISSVADSSKNSFSIKVVEVSVGDCDSGSSLIKSAKVEMLADCVLKCENWSSVKEVPESVAIGSGHGFLSAELPKFGVMLLRSMKFGLSKEAMLKACDNVNQVNELGKMRTIFDVMTKSKSRNAGNLIVKLLGHVVEPEIFSEDKINYLKIVPSMGVGFTVSGTWHVTNGVKEDLKIEIVAAVCKDVEDLSLTAFAPESTYFYGKTTTLLIISEYRLVCKLELKLSRRVPFRMQQLHHYHKTPGEVTRMSDLERCHVLQADGMMVLEPDIADGDELVFSCLDVHLECLCFLIFET